MLVFDTAVQAAILDHARRGAPAEICGVLGGVFGERISHVRRVEPVPNVASQPQTRYRLDPAEQLGAMDGIEAAGLDVVGFYHSHPRGPAHPSETDRRDATWAGYSYVIVTLANQPKVGSWRWRGERFGREHLRVQASASKPT